MKKVSKKNVSYFFAMLGAAFFITITGCKKDQTKTEGAASDKPKTGTLSVSPASNPPGSVNTPSGPPADLELATARGCLIQFGSDMSNPGIPSQQAASNYFACNLISFPDSQNGPNSGGGMGMGHPKSLSDYRSTTLLDFFVNLNTNNPSDVAKVKAYLSPYILNINTACSIGPWPNHPINTADVMSKLWENYYVDQYTQYQYLAIIEVYFEGANTGGKDPLWEAAGFGQILGFDNLHSFEPAEPIH